ncbi:hypothetical protein [Actinokineospora terrae]|uniref:F5/8 type C domain-containing protein n=1 Tax=Actinokineospora terrae TaxID=155974 RepID=A0A1H9MV57_9PSEU|nr:hypothetical protein [Actinokineospora terrae]SER27295.1 hypothetical protein SAMN04487818_102340 [Actinokineospora terrae]
MPLIARKNIPAALALLTATVLGVVVPTATATPNPEGAAAPLTSAPGSVKLSPVPSTSNQPVPCDVHTSPTTTTTTPSTPRPTYTPAPAAAGLTTFPPSSSTPPLPGENFARTGSATASSTFAGYNAHRVNDGDTSADVGCDHSWSSAKDRSPTITPEWVQVRWSTLRSVSHIVVFTSEGYQLRDFDVQVLHGNEGWWDTVATYNYNTNTRVNVWFGAKNTRGVRILAKVGPSHQPLYVRVNEIQAFAY